MHRSYKVELTMKAKNDFKSLIKYIKDELQEPSIANKYAKLVKEEVQNLKYFPQKYAIIDDETIKDLNIRKLVIKNYIAFYRVNEEKRIVNVERILYGGSNWINKL